jgi:hypothetical protein
MSGRFVESPVEVCSTQSMMQFEWPLVLYTEAMFRSCAYPMDEVP